MKSSFYAMKTHFKGNRRPANPREHVHLVDLEKSYFYAMKSHFNGSRRPANPREHVYLVECRFRKKFFLRYDSKKFFLRYDSKKFFLRYDKIHQIHHTLQFYVNSNHLLTQHSAPLLVWISQGHVCQF